ncbi:MAG: hypothetical protein EOM37_09795 [Proteobacteria bacterium]|nr:hypothetical protein [Pseudomonadota bacterium]
MGQEILDERQAEEIQMLTEIINTMAAVDGYSSIDACLKDHPDQLDTYTRYASAALRAMRYVQGFPVQIIIDDSEEDEENTDTFFDDGARQ